MTALRTLQGVVGRSSAFPGSAGPGRPGEWIASPTPAMRPAGRRPSSSARRCVPGPCLPLRRENDSKNRFEAGLSLAKAVVVPASDGSSDLDPAGSEAPVPRSPPRSPAWKAPSTARGPAETSWIMTSGGAGPHLAATREVFLGSNDSTAVARRSTVEMRRPLRRPASERQGPRRWTCEPLASR